MRPTACQARGRSGRGPGSSIEGLRPSAVNIQDRDVVWSMRWTRENQKRILASRWGSRSGPGRMMRKQKRTRKISEIDLSRYPNLRSLAERQIEIWPEHEATLATSISSQAPAVLEDSEHAAALITKIALDHFGSIDKVCNDYRYFCQEMILEAELFFRRYKRYERTTFKEALEDIYSKPDIMERYMNGLLLSGLFWLNHANALTFYRGHFIDESPEGYSHLEVGPGHGTLLYFASIHPKRGSVTGWDVSPSSIEATRRALTTIGVEDQVELVCQDVYDAAGAEHQFDNIVVSEVLEHLEDPASALESLYTCLKPGARIYVNMPANSPAPDHIYLISDPEDTLRLMEAAGMEIIESRLFPMTGYSLEQCRKHALTINCAAIGRRPE